ncbi:hypothetical protein AB205_0159440 [Aquarana catesbeiana]|uniref:MADF domain-containing protein n=1 Tax=Aquarana catesbeiana TaxID=8400 RepID=A0A2G9R6P2_AQUCT|nr:hypothetical protein AB205_0159440 [Aquarana catesbeiana]
MHAASHHSRAKARRHVAVLGDREKSPGPQVHDWDLPPGSGNHYSRDLFCHHSSPAEGLYSDKMVDKFTAPDSLPNFIQQYRELPCPWQVTCRDFSNKIKRKAAMEKLLELRRLCIPRQTSII